MKTFRDLPGQTYAHMHISADCCLKNYKKAGNATNAKTSKNYFIK